jgi:hypothetical protein
MQFQEKKIEEFKTKHGEIFAIEIEDKSCLVRKPTRKDISFAQASAPNNPYKMQEVLFDNCWIEGDAEFKEKVDYFLPALDQFSKIIETKTAELKKL